MPWGGAPVQKPWLKQNQQQPRLVMPPQRFGGGAKGGGGGWRPTYGGGWRPGYGGAGGYRGGGYLRPRNPPQTVPAGYEVDPNARYNGTVNFYHKWKGYGFIDVATPGVVPNNRVFVHWRQLQSDDRFPFLQKDVVVEFSLMTWRDWSLGSALTVRAKNVTQAVGDTGKGRSGKGRRLPGSQGQACRPPAACFRSLVGAAFESHPFLDTAREPQLRRVLY